MCAFIGLALALSVRLVEGAPGCHWDGLAPIFLQQEQEGASPSWSFTLGEPSTVPDVLGLELTKYKDKMWLICLRFFLAKFNDTCLRFNYGMFFSNGSLGFCKAPSASNMQYVGLNFR